MKGDGLADTIPRMAEQKLGHYFPDYLGKIEAAIYYVLAVLLSATALLTIATAGELLWDGLSHWTLAAQTLRVLNELLIVLMLVEILHTVRISVRSHILITEPFLVVGLIASIRRIWWLPWKRPLSAEKEPGPPAGRVAFVLLRRFAPAPTEAKEV